MFDKLRRLNISLAAKCQILFGAAVVLIIAAALFVPWRRMDGLMEQINERSAEALVRTVLTEHAAEQMAHRTATTQPSATQPTTRPDAPLAWPATTQPAVDGKVAYGRPVLVPVSALHDPASLTPFERRAFARFIRDEQLTYSSYYDRDEGGYGYRYARGLFASTETSCLQCHSSAKETAALPLGQAPPPTTTAPSLPTPVLLPTTQPAVATAALPELPEGFLGIVAVDIPSQVPTSQYLLNRVFLLTAGLLAGSLAIVVFYLITTRLILQPVRVLQETAEKVSEGDLNIRSDINTGDEFQQLSETFNTMLVNLSQTQDRLRTINRNLDLKLNQLAESNLALYESNRLKSEFLANVSHELRTPLNSILGFAELLNDAAERIGDGKSARYVQNIQRSGKNLLELINDLLDLAKIEAGKMEVRVEPLSIGDLFEGLAGILKPLTEQHELSIHTTVARDVPIVLTDPAKLQQVLYNFLSNAIKFSPKGGVITMAAVREPDGQIRITVTDRGPGIDPAMHKTIFEKFRQIDGSVTRQHSGTGLGLAISKELVELLHGKIGVISAPGEGATFWVVLPPKITSSTEDVRANVVLT